MPSWQAGPTSKADPIVSEHAMDSRVMIKDDADSLPPPPRLLPYRGLLACNFMLFAVTTATLGVAIANLVDSRVTVKTDFDVDEEVVARGGMAGQRFAPLPGDVWQDGSKPKLIVAAFPDFPPYVTWNNSLGQPDKLTGFGYDFLLEACDVCDLDCEIVIDKWSNCWTATDLPGTGLQAGYYHGCATYTNQYQRQWSLEFSDGILQKNKPAGILSRLVNGVPTIPPTSDLSGFKICDVAGWAPTIKTLYYSENDCTDHSLFKDFIIVTPPDEGPDPAMTMLLNGECDGVYMYSDLIEKRQVCNGCAWDPALYSQLGTEYAWVHTGVVEHMANGTTLTM